MSTATTATTAEELLRVPDDGHRYELIHGRLHRMSPAGYRHGRVANRIAHRLTLHVEANGLGVVCAAETGFKLASSPDHVRAPGAAFITRERVAAAGDPAGFWAGAPDLAIEVVSPSDSPSDVETKVFDWLDGGARLVVVIDPQRRTATTYRSRSRIVVLGDSETLDGDDVVAGWRVRVGDFF